MICENPSHYIHCPEAVLDYVLLIDYVMIIIDS